MTAESEVGVALAATFLGNAGASDHVAWPARRMSTIRYEQED